MHPTASSFTSFGALLRFLRRRAQLTQAELSIAVGYSREHIARLERQQRRPDLASVAALFVPALDLCDEPETARLLLRLAGEVHTPPDAPAAAPIAAAPAPRAPAPPPAPLLPLIGRAHDLARINARLSDPATRLLTIVGPPGVGKTRLAHEVAWAASAAWGEGVYLVELAGLSDGLALSGAVASALGLNNDGRDGAAQLRGYLQRRRALLVLDNCEHLATIPPLISDLLAACPRLTVLATSRAPLQCYGEHEYVLAPLQLPDLTRLAPPAALAEVAAVALLVARAQAVRDDFGLTEANALALAAICVRLDGLPLAIELAAAQLRLMEPTTLATQLARAWGSEYLSWLRSRSRQLAPRQQTLLGALDWSYRLLSPAQQRRLAQLGVFRGSFAGAAAYAVWDEQPASVAPGQAHDPLAELVEHSLLQLAGRAAETPRFAMLETIRAYALHQLGDAASAVHDRHAAFFLALAEQAAPHLRWRSPQIWLERLERDHDNLRAALTWLCSHAPVQALRLAGALGGFWSACGYQSEGRRWLAQALAAPDSATLARARASLSNAMLTHEQGDHSEALRLAQHSLALYEACHDQAGVAQALSQCGWAAAALGQLGMAQRFFAASLASCRVQRDQEGVAYLLSALVHVERQIGDLDSARRHLGESLTIFQQRGSPEGRANALHQQGALELHQGNSAAAILALDEAVAIFRARQMRRDLGWALCVLGEAYLRQGAWGLAAGVINEAATIFAALDIPQGSAIQHHQLGLLAEGLGQRDQAGAAYRRGLLLAQQIGFEEMAARCMAGIGAVALAGAQLRLATALLAAARQRMQQLPPFLAPADEAAYRALVAASRCRLGEATFAAAWTQGCAWPWVQAVQLAVGLAARGETAPIPAEDVVRTSSCRQSMI